MALLESKSTAASAWAAVAHAGNAEPAMAAPASSLATWVQQGAAERQQRSELSWFDVEFINFSENGQFLNVTEGNLRTALQHQTRSVGRILYQFGATREEFVFADPEHDVKALKRGIIHSLRPVKESEILKMLSEAGVFDIKNKSHYGVDRYSYSWKEGQAQGKLDFSTVHLKKLVNANFNVNSEQEIVPFFFYLEGIAHNYFNFGNFLYGAAGAALGLKIAELTAGAHANSLLHSETNGYPMQLDSQDDQFSIVLGYEHAQKRHYAQRMQRWVQPVMGLPRMPF